MTARCASCSYPLSVSDSVSCFECLSYFHIDCAQLVGFPYYELSAEPVRNTFRCTTCRLLPIPGRSQDPQCAADSDSDCEDAMPSRQLDYHHLEPPGDLAQDMHELKGTVQDLSDLCKDMLREINDLKSINLALRCGVENLRHESEDKGKAIDELRKRLDALEGNRVGSKSNGLNSDGSNERLDAENNCISDSLNCGTEDKILGCVQSNDTSVVRKKRNVEFSDSNRDFLKCEKNIEKIIRSSDENISESADGSKVLRDSLNNSVLSPERVKEKRKDWDWRGKRAVELNSSREESDAEEGETEESDIEEAEKAWETLHKEVISQQKVSSEVSTNEIKTEEKTKQVCSEDKLETKLNSKFEDKDTNRTVSGESEHPNEICHQNDNTIDEEPYAGLNKEANDEILESERVTEDTLRKERSEERGNTSRNLTDIRDTEIETKINVDDEEEDLEEKETITSTEEVSDENPINYESEEEHSVLKPVNDEVEEHFSDEVRLSNKCIENEEGQYEQVSPKIKEEKGASEGVSEYESENEEDNEEEELVTKNTSNDFVEVNSTEKAISNLSGNNEEQQNIVNLVVEEEKSVSEDISDYEREEEADDRSTNTLREDLDDLDALDEVDEGCVEDSDRLEREESETLANDERSVDKTVVDEENIASASLFDEKVYCFKDSRLIYYFNINGIHLYYKHIF